MTIAPPQQPSFRAEQADFSASVRSCEPIGLRSEKSLFDQPACSDCNADISAPFLSLLCALCVSVLFCVKSFSGLFPATHYSPLTTHSIFLSSSALPLRTLRLCVIFFFSLLLTRTYFKTGYNGLNR